MFHHLAIHKLDETEAHYDFEQWDELLTVVNRIQPSECKGFLVVMGNDLNRSHYFHETEGGPMQLTEEGLLALGNDGAKPL